MLCIVRGRNEGVGRGMVNGNGEADDEESGAPGELRDRRGQE